MLTTVLGLAAFTTRAYGHGLVTSPATRGPGNATAAVCGQTMVDFYRADNTSYPEHFFRTGGTSDPGYNPALCNMWLCKGFQWEDNTLQLMPVVPGTVIPIEVFIRIPHVGHANVSIVDTTTNTVVGEPLIEWPSGYADGALFPNLPANQTSFNVTIPELSPRCTMPGTCVCHDFSQTSSFWALPCPLNLLTPECELLQGNPMVLVRSGSDI
jgi:hypothetical protein